MADTQKKVSTKDIRFFNRVEVLTHPFFALENIRIRRRAESLKNIGVKESIGIYERMNLLKNWKEEIEKVKKDPNAIMFLFGIQEKETRRYNRYIKRSFNN